MREESVGIASGSPERFGYEWDNYSEIKPEYETQFQRWLPFYSPRDWKGKSFLDVGCGMGRNSYWPMSYGASEGLAVDVDDRSLEAARKNLAGFPEAKVRRLSAYDIDMTNAFDIVFSIGVIHHLEFPQRALAAMVSAARPGGDVAIWVYGRENNGWLLWFLDPLRRALFSRLPIGMVHSMSVVPTLLLWSGLKLGLGRVEYFRLIRDFDFSHLRSIVFDQMLPVIAHYWRRDEVEDLLRRAGLEDIELVWVNEMSWAARGNKPKKIE